MPVHPTAMAGATFLAIIAAGKFHGAIIPATPIGCLIFTIRRSAHGELIVSPWTRRHSCDDQSLLEGIKYTFKLTK